MLPMTFKLKIRAKITGLLVFYFLIALLAIGTTLLVSWRLEGGAAAINDAGRERMRSYRIAFLLEKHTRQPSAELWQDIQYEISQFEKTLNELKHGNPQRPLFLPKEVPVQAQMMELQMVWRDEILPHIRTILTSHSDAERAQLLDTYRHVVEQYVENINQLVTMIEHSNAHAANLLRFLQIVLVGLALVGTILLIHLFTVMVIQPVTDLREGIQRMASADFGVRLPVMSQDELGELASGFNRMADELQDLYSTMEQRVEEKTRSIEAKNRELAALDKEVAVSEERNLLAQELHDSIAQSLAFLNIQVQLLQDDLQKQELASAQKTLGQIREGVQESYDDVRELLVHFRTRIGTTDLETAIRSALEKFEGQTGIKTKFKFNGTPPVLEPEQVLQVMHIVQESLSNVRKHAKASQVEVKLGYEGQHCVDIRDNGIGFNVEHDAGDNHVGLRIMRERAHRIGAKLSFDAKPNKGTHICLILPECPTKIESA